MEPVLVSVGNDFRVWETSDYSQLYSYVPEKQSGPVGIYCTSWSTDTSAVASFIKDESKILLTYYKNEKYFTHEICIQGVNNLSYLQFPRTSQNHLYLASKNELHYYDLGRSKSRKSFSLKSDISCLVSNKSDSYVAIGCKNGAIVLLTTVSNQLSQPFTAKGCAGQHITTLRYSPVKTGFLGASCESGVLSFWDCNANKNIFNISDHLAPCTSFAFSPLNDSLAVSCGLDKKLICHDTNSKKSVFNLELEYPCTAVDFDTDGRTVAVGTSRGKILVYDLRNTSRVYKSVVAHSGRVTALAYKPKIDKINVSQVMSTVKSTSKSRLRTQASGSALKTVQEEKEKENHKPGDEPVLNVGKEMDTADMQFTPAMQFNLASPLDLDAKVNRRESISSQLFSPLKEADISFNTPNPSSRGSSRRTSDARLSTEGLFSPLREIDSKRSTPLATPSAGSPFLTSIEEEVVSSADCASTIKSTGNNVAGNKSEVPAKLSLETLTEVAKSVTQRAEGSPEYQKTEFKESSSSVNIVSTSAKKVVPDFAEESSSYPSISSGLIKPLSVTKSSLRDKTPPVYSTSATEDIVRVRDLPHSVQNVQPVHNMPANNDLFADEDKVDVSPDTNLGLGSEVNKFFSESEALNSELKRINTAFPGALLQNELSPRNTRPLSRRVHVPNTTRTSTARGSLHSTTSSDNEVEGFNRRYVEEIVSSAMEEWCTGVEERIVTMHYSIIRIMQQHQEETRKYIEEIHKMEEIKKENEKLVLENEQLKRPF